MARFKPLTLMQVACLVALTAYTSGLSFLMHASRSDPRKQYLVSTSVFFAELLKLAVSIAMEYRNVASSQSQLSSFDLESEEKLLESTPVEEKELEMVLTLNENRKVTLHAVEQPFYQILQLIFTKDCWKLALPAVLYLCQNMLQLFAITTISPVVYQALTQMKILAASALSVMILKRTYSKQQWLSIVVLVIGVTLLSNSKVKDHHLDVKQPTVAPLRIDLAFLMRQAQKSCGVAAVLAACTFGSGGAVIMEMTVKDGKASLWLRNAQLAFFSLLPAGAAVLYNAHTTGIWDPMRNFGALTWSTVLARSLGGFLISYVLKQCDAIMKGIATSIAMILSLVIETSLEGKGVSIYAVIGAALVFVSSVTYVRYQLF